MEHRNVLCTTSQAAHRQDPVGQHCQEQQWDDAEQVSNALPPALSRHTHTIMTLLGLGWWTQHVLC